MAGSQSREPETFLLPELDGWLSRRRWFVRRPGATAATLAAVVPLGGRLRCCLVASGGDLFFAPLVSDAPGASDTVADASGRAWSDALEDPESAREILRALLRGRIEGAGSTLEARLLDRPALERSLSGDVRVGTAEQTNSWFLCGDSFVKVFRRLDFSGNLDVETLEGLASRTDLSVPRLRAVLEAGDGNGSAVVVAVQQAVAHERNAWEEACAQVGAAARGEVRDGAGWRLLGERVATLHAAMAQVFGTTRIDDGERDRFGEPAAALARDVVAELSSTDRSGWAVAPRRAADAFLSGAGALFPIFSGRAPEGLVLQRVHGDLHLGQVLSCGGDWTVIDFEGEPARTPAERRAPAHPAKDVAGMLRSFDYACRAGLPGDPSASALDAAARWRDAARAAFLGGYQSVERVQPLWPDSEERRGWLLDLHEAEKAFYELRYELRHRPDWVSIPLGGLLALSSR